MFSFQVADHLSAIQNMKRDEQLFYEGELPLPPSPSPNLERGGVRLLIYSWLNPAISFGYSQNIEKLVDINKAKTLGIELVKRITGGGMVLHQPGELTYCLVASKQLFKPGIISSCNQISEIIIKALGKLDIKANLAGRKGQAQFRETFCFARPTKYEILYKDKKLVGSAQRRGKQVFLQHGSIQLDKRLAIFEKLFDCSALDDTQISINEIAKKKIGFNELASFMGEEVRGYITAETHRADAC